MLSAEQDSFYKDNMFNNFGDLGTSIKNLVEQYQAKTKQSHQAVNSIGTLKLSLLVLMIRGYEGFCEKLSGH